MGLGPSQVNSEDIVEQKAQQNMDIMNYRMAISGFEQVLESDSNKKGIRTKMAFCHFRLEENDRAIELLNEELMQFPDDPEALILLSLVFYQQENVEEALKVCHRYIPVFDEILKEKKKSLGKEYRATKENEKIFSIKLHQENPNYGLPHFILGLEQKKKEYLIEPRIILSRLFKQGMIP